MSQRVHDDVKPPKTNDGGAIPYLLLILAITFFALNYVVARAVHLDCPPVMLAVWRWGGAALLLLPFAWSHFGDDWPEAMRDKKRRAVLDQRNETFSRARWDRWCAPSIWKPAISFAAAAATTSLAG